MARKWDELTNDEQEEAVGLLHQANHKWKEMYNAPNKQLDLIETAINTLDDHRRKFRKVRGMTDYGAGVVVLLFNENGSILIGKRKGAHGAGTWSLPGGKLEFGKSSVQQAHDELQEETGLDIPLFRFKQREWVDNIWEDESWGQQHWVTLFTQVLYNDEDGLPRVMEPNKCEEWRFVHPDRIMSPPLKDSLFPPLANYIRQFGIQQE